MSVSSGLKRPHQKRMARDTCLFIIAKLSVHTLVRFGLVFQRSVTLPLPPSPCLLLMCGKRCVPSATRPTRQQVATTSPGTQEVGGMCGPMNQLKRPKPQNHSLFNAMRTWRRGRTTESENACENTMKTPPTGTHAAMSEVMATHSKTEVDRVSFLVVGRGVPDNCTKIAECADL